MPTATLVLALTFTLGAAAATDAEVEQETAAWHQKRKARLTAEDSWLTLVGLYWLDEPSSTAGSAPGSRLVFPAPAPEKLGVFTRTGMRVRFSPEPGVPVTLN